MNYQTTVMIETTSHHRRRGMSLLLAITVLAVGVLTACLPARANAASPALAITISGVPTNFPSGTSTGAVQYAIQVKNIGSAPTDGTPITVTATLPPGLARNTEVYEGTGLNFAWNGVSPVGVPFCDGGPPITCTTPLTPDPTGQMPSVLAPDDTLDMTVYADASPGLDGTTVTGQATVTGGGAPSASASTQDLVSAEPAPFGFQATGSSLTDAAGNTLTQAGAHPFNLNTRLLLNSIGTSNGASTSIDASGLLHDAHVVLPPGLVVNPQATPVRCTEAEFEAMDPFSSAPKCPDASAVGLARSLTPALGGNINGTIDATVYNLVPPAGVPAELGFAVEPGPFFIHLHGGVDTAGNYALTADLTDLNTYGHAMGVDLDLWGDPSNPAHDFRRGDCLNQQVNVSSDPNRALCPVAPSGTPFLTLPSACSGPLQTSFSIDSYGVPGNFLTGTALTTDSQNTPVGVSGCSTLDFEPSLTAQPDTSQAASPSGLNVDLKIPQTNSMETLASANLKKTVVTLPAGVSVNPSAADGLGSCSLSQIGLTTAIGQTPAHFTAAPDTCPDAAKIGDVTVTTPLLGEPLDGSVYIAQQEQNPFGSLLALYVTVKDPKTGVVIKLPGKVDPDSMTGQLKATFDNTPQLPFGDFQLHFKGGNRGVLVTPSTCGSYQTTSAFSPWSAADPDHPSAAETRTSTDGFTIGSGPNGAPCVSSPAQSPFAPSFTAGSVNPTAGAFTPLSVTFSRSDQEQELGGVTVRTAPGLLGRIAGVPFCGEPQAAQGTCPVSSQIGHVQVSAGAGPSPVSIPQAGRPQDPVFLTGPYKGAPFGLSIVVPAQAGPFDLGTVVVRSAIFVDPHTAQITVVSDPFPTILRGIPLKVRTVSVVVDREGFMFNPTSCDPMSMGGTLTSTQGVTVGVSSRFQAAGCAGLPFKPGFSASTQGATSKANGASLTVNVSARPGEANIHRVDLQLPKALPARLTTLQKACTAAQFEANPAGCPPGSVIGTATARTPVLNVPLTGPAYLVSHGGAAFPDVEFVLQANERGGVVEIVLDGATDIKKGITYSRFETVPDAPISSFETVLPTGPHSVLATDIPASAKNSLCGQSLTIPTTIVAQSGATVTQTTRIGVTGCARVKTKALTRSQKLAKALKACHKKVKGAKRANCERAARKKYGPVKKARKARK